MFTPNDKYLQAVNAICNEDNRYDREAFFFVQQAVVFTQDDMKKRGRQKNQHISGHELLNGIRKFALDQFGPMALYVLTEWGVKTTEDFGNLVFLMIKHNLLGSSEQDTIDDFINVYDFEDSFADIFSPSGTPPDIPIIG
jgi:uncharacterized repeat protein (TIGR04138 family)